MVRGTTEDNRADLKALFKSLKYFKEFSRKNGFNIGMDYMAICGLLEESLSAQVPDNASRPASQKNLTHTTDGPVSPLRLCPPCCIFSNSWLTLPFLSPCPTISPEIQGK